MAKAKARGNGQGSAYRRGSVWEAQVIVGYRPARTHGGQPVPIKRRKSGFPTKRDALAYCSTLLKSTGERRKQAPRLLEYWDTYRSGEYTKLSESKQTAYRIAWAKLRPLHDLRVDVITVDSLRTAVSSACPTYYTARDCRSLLTNLFGLAAADGWCSKDLPSFIVLPKMVEKEREVFTQDEQASLWRLYESGDIRAAIPLLMIYSAMMPGEAMRLRVEHIDLTARTITGAGMKTKVRKATPIVLSESIIPLVEDLIATAQPSGYIFPQNEDTWYSQYYAALDLAGCRRLTPYSCRHTTATALAITENIAPQTIQKVMRWSTTRMLDRYAHPKTADALTAVDALKK